MFAEDLVRGWVGAVAGIFAPGFQPVRGAGKAQYARSYVAGKLPVINTLPEIVELSGTAGGNIHFIR